MAQGPPTAPTRIQVSVTQGGDLSRDFIPEIFRRDLRAKLTAEITEQLSTRFPLYTFTSAEHAPLRMEFQLTKRPLLYKIFVDLIAEPPLSIRPAAVRHALGIEASPRGMSTPEIAVSFLTEQIRKEKAWSGFQKDVLSRIPVLQGDQQDLLWSPIRWRVRASGDLRRPARREWLVHMASRERELERDYSGNSEGPECSDKVFLIQHSGDSGASVQDSNDKFRSAKDTWYRIYLESVAQPMSCQTRSVDQLISPAQWGKQ